MPIEPLEPLVIPPTQATPAADWPDQADAFVTDQRRWTVEFNSQTIPEMNAVAASLDDAKTYVDDALAEVVVNADRAEQQAGIATTQAGLAEQQADRAEIMAAAAGAAAGVPALEGNAGKALIVNEDETSMIWGDPSQSVGDVLITVRDPGPLYLPADGSIYLQSAYPELFAEVGIYGGEPANNWSSKAMTAGINIPVHLGGSSWASLNTSNNTVYRSNDNGDTWVPALVIPILAQTITRAGNTILIGAQTSLTAGYTGRFYRTNLDLDTPTSVDIGVNKAPRRACGDGQGNWFVGIGDNTYMKSSDDGLSFSSAVAPFSAAPGSMAMSADGVLIVCSTSAIIPRISRDRGATWANLPSGANTMSQVAYDGAVTWVVAGSAGAIRSVNHAVNFGAITSLGASAIATDGSGVWVGGTLRSVDNAATWVTATGKVAAGQTDLALSYGADGVWMGSGLNVVYIGKPSYDFDPTTQFRIPSISFVSNGVGQSYIKARSIAP